MQTDVDATANGTMWRRQEEVDRHSKQPRFRARRSSSSNWSGRTGEDPREGFDYPALLRVCQ
jgi:hypothetical protein